jgi:predicted RNA-binding protein with PUA-like domain
MLGDVETELHRNQHTSSAGKVVKLLDSRLVQYWLYKSEPEVYGIDHLGRDGTSIWDGVRNYQARNNLMAAAIGDRVFFYHSSAEPPGIAGLAEVVETGVVDPLQFDPDSKYYDPTSKPGEPRWITVRIKFVEKFPSFLPLVLLREVFSTDELPILRKGNRLSVTPVPEPTALRLLEIANAGL